MRERASSSGDARALTGDADALLRFWFSDALESPAAASRRAAVWFAPPPAFDAEVVLRFASLPEQAVSGSLDSWADTARGAVARVIALDQLPRNLHRTSLRAFACDPMACRAAYSAIDAGFDAALHPLEAGFLYLPLEHSEARADQERCVMLFAALEARAPAGFEAVFSQFTSYAARHRDIVERFGRFPHRNQVLGRASTPEEAAFLAAGGETFGGAPVAPRGEEA